MHVISKAHAEGRGPLKLAEPQDSAQFQPERQPLSSVSRGLFRRDGDEQRHDRRIERNNSPIAEYKLRKRGFETRIA